VVDPAASVWRDFVTDGVPASGTNKPLKSKIRQWGTWLEGVVTAFTSNGGLIYTSLAAMNADLAHGANTSAWVVGDATVANNGIYQKIGATGTGSWSRVTDLPYSFISASNAGAGTANALVATTAIPLPANDAATLIALNITTNNTGAATVAFNGGSPLTIKTNNGNDVAANYLVAGQVVAGYVSAGTFRLLSDVASAADRAAAETAATNAAASAAAAAASASSINLPSPVASTFLQRNAGNTAYVTLTPSQTMDTVSPATTRGDILFRNATTMARLAASTAGYLLQTNGAGTDPSYVGFVPAGTGAVTRTWQNKARDRIDVADFGAVGDGSTNNSTAIQAAITALGATGGTIYFGPGDFRIGTAITIPNNVWLKGAGRYATIITGTSATMDNFSISAAGNCGILDMGISTSIAKTAGAGISIVSASQNIVLRNLGISTQLTGIKIDASGSIWLDEIEISAIKATTGVGILINGTNDHYLRNVFCKASAIGSQCAAGFRITATGGTWMSGCGALWCNNGLEIIPGAAQTVQHLFSTMNAYDTGTGYGILINAAAGTTVNRCYFVQDWTSTNTNDGFYALGAGTVNDINIIAHRAYQNGAFGIHFDAGVNVKIHDCTVAGNSATTINTSDGIAVNASNVSIKNNRVGNAGGFGAQQRYGLLLNGTNTNIHVEGNDLSGNASGPINNGLTSATSRIENNMGYNPVGVQAAATAGASPYTYTAGPSPETVYFKQSATNTATITQGGQQIAALAGATTYYPVQLGPNESVVVTWTTTAPTYTKMVH
jgi:hypothetical protein